MMNNPFADRMARSFAERVRGEAGADPAAAGYARLPVGLRPAADGCRGDRAVRVVQEAGLRPVCWALLNASEFVYVK